METKCIGPRRHFTTEQINQKSKKNIPKPNQNHPDMFGVSLDQSLDH